MTEIFLFTFCLSTLHTWNGTKIHDNPASLHLKHLGYFEIENEKVLIKFVQKIVNF